MSVAVVLVGCHFKILGLGAALDVHDGGLSFLLRKDGLHVELAELHFGLYSKKTLASCNEGSGQGEADVSGFNIFDDVVFLAGVFQTDLVFKIEGGFGIVVDAQFQAVANGTLDVHLNALVKIEGGGLAHALLQGGVVDFGGADTQTEFGDALGSNVDDVAAEYGFKGFSAYPKATELVVPGCLLIAGLGTPDRKSTRLNSSHVRISYAVFCLKTKTYMYE